MSTLSSLFQKSKGAPVEVDGELVHAIFRMHLDEGKTQFEVRRLGATDAALGLRIKIERGILEVNGGQYQEIILWVETSPDVVHLNVLAKRDCVVKVWNVWRVDDVIQAWVGNAGMLIHDDDGVIRLECSSGQNLDFSSLVVEFERQNSEKTRNLPLSG